MRPLQVKQGKKLSYLMLVLIIAIISLSACGGNGATNSSVKNDGNNVNQDNTNQPAETPKKLTKVTQVTNWFAQPEHGGQYAALAKGFYEEVGIEMTIMPGGPQVSSIQQVASGQVQFGMAQADELLVARNQGIPVVAIAAPFQINPQAIMFHTEEAIASASEIGGRTVYIAPGAMYWEYLKKAYDLKDFKELAFTGNFSGFLTDKRSAIQSYITSDPYLLKQQGVDVSFIRIHDTGYQPYANVLFTTEKMIQENPELVKAYVEASMKGWKYFKDNYEEINPVIQKENPDLTLESMKSTAENEIELIFGGDAKTSGVGIMTSERWTTLAQQLANIGIIKNTDEVKHVFNTEFLPK